MSKEIWYQKLKTYVPSWVFEKEEKSEALFRGLAAVFSQIEEDYIFNKKQTEIDEAEIEYLEEMGRERGIIRLSGESISAYRQRVKVIKNRSNCPDIKQIVDTLLINGESTIVEHYDSGIFFFNRVSYFNRGVIPSEFLYNTFTVLVPDQTRPAETFFSREYFCNRENILGSNESNIELFNQIVSAVNQNKAFGIFYRLFETQ